MKNEIETKIIKILKELTQEEKPWKEIEHNCNLTELGLNSISLIKAFVELEKEFNIEFEDDDLDLSRFKTIEDISEYIKMKMNE